MFVLPIEPVLVFILIFIRALLLLSFLPVYGEVFTPIRVRVLLGVTLSMVMVSIVDLNLNLFPQSIPEFFILMLPEALLGFSIGLVGRLLFGAMQFGGTVIGKEIGFQFANMLDPSQTVQIPVVGQMMYVASLLVFLAVRGDHQFFLAFERSFRLAPPGFFNTPDNLHVFFNERATEMFIVGVQLALPVIASIFIVNMGMGMMAKGVPQMHVFMESFPIKILVGLILLSVLSSFLIQVMVDRTMAMGGDLIDLLRLFHQR
jgi:flagellar biosynthesis protein FliR